MHAFALQMRAFFSTGAGGALFGPAQPIAQHAVDTIAAVARLVAARGFTGDSIPTVGGLRLQQWVDAHPLTGLDFDRVSLATEWPAIRATTGGGVIQTVGSIEQTLDRVSDRLGFANRYVTKQVRWNTELMITSVFDRLGLDTVGTHVGSIAAHGTTALDRIGGLAAETPGLAARERTAILSALDDERVAVASQLDAARTAATHDVDAERVATFAGLRDERVAITASMDSIVRHAIDQAFWRATQLLVVVVLLAALLLVVARWLLWHTKVQ